MGTTISKTIIRITVLHRTDEPLGNIYEALERIDTGHGVGNVEFDVAQYVQDANVEEELRMLGNDGEFFDDDLNAETDVCRHCGHGIRNEGGWWIAPDAGFDTEGGDGIWRDSCPDNHESREAPHEPGPETTQRVHITYTRGDDETVTFEADFDKAVWDAVMLTGETGGSDAELDAFDAEANRIVLAHDPTCATLGWETNEIDPSGPFKGEPDAGLEDDLRLIRKFDPEEQR